MTRTDPHVSQFQRDVGQAMEALRMGFQSEVVLAEGYSVDLAMVERRIAIEVDGNVVGGMTDKMPCLHKTTLLIAYRKL